MPRSSPPECPMSSAMPSVPSVIGSFLRGAARTIPGPLAAALLISALAGCSRAVTTVFPPACPHAGVAADLADLTRFRPAAPSGGGPGGGQDLTDMVLDGRITGVAGDCTRADSHHLDVTLVVSLALTRGPAARGRLEPVQFLVAVSDHGQVLDKQIFRIAPEFAANSDTVRLTSDPVSLSLPISPEKPGSAYDVVVGFQLTPDELALNRRRGPR